MSVGRWKIAGRKRKKGKKWKQKDRKVERIGSVTDKEDNEAKEREMIQEKINTKRTGK